MGWGALVTARAAECGRERVPAMGWRVTARRGVAKQESLSPYLHLATRVPPVRRPCAVPTPTYTNSVVYAVYLRQNLARE